MPIFGKFGGGLKELSPVDLGVYVMKAAIERAEIEGKDLDLYIFGNILNTVTASWCRATRP